MHTLPSEGNEIRRIILLRLLGETPEVLLRLEGTHPTLPEVQIARCQRVAPQLTAAFQQTCCMEAVSVSSLEARPEEAGSERIAYEIMEPRKPQDGFPHDMLWAPVKSLVESAFRDRDDFQAVRQAVAQSIASAEAASRGPFACLGWFRELEQWVQEEIGAQGLHLSGGFRQLNACPTFSLIRFETDGPAVWFKAVGAPNKREYALTLALTRSFSRFLPEIISTRAEWDSWLSREAEGPLLNECSEFGAWETAARDLAQLQIHSLNGSAHLLDANARDLRTSALADLVKPFFETMGDVMEQQTKMPPIRLSRAQLSVLAARVGDAFAVLDATRISNALGHLDLNPGNIVCSPAGSVFLDWAEAFVGHPFLTFEYLLEHFRRTFGQDTSEEAQLVASYSFPWRAFASEIDLRRTLQAASLVAVFAYAVGIGAWTDPQRIVEARTAGYLRSLTRRMERESHALSGRSVLCPN